MTNIIPKSSLAYLATPFTDTADPTLAWLQACQIAGRLMRAGIHLFAPIPHSQGICCHSTISMRDHQFWLDQNELILRRCDVLIVVQMDGFESSRGIAHEIAAFVDMGKPIFDLDPVNLMLSKRSFQPIPARSSESPQGRNGPVEIRQGGERAGDFWIGDPHDA